MGYLSLAPGEAPSPTEMLSPPPPQTALPKPLYSPATPGLGSTHPIQPPPLCFAAHPQTHSQGLFSLVNELLKKNSLKTTKQNKTQGYSPTAAAPR